YYFPSFPLQVAASAMGLSRAGITVNVGRSLRLGNRTIPTSQEGMMLIPYDGGSKAFSSYSVADVLTGKIPRDKFSDKIVFIGVTASGLSSGVQDFMTTPLANKFPGVEKQAQVAAAILEGRFIARPSWAPFLEFGLVVILGIVLTYCLPRLGGFFPLVVSLGIFLGLSTLMVGSLLYGFWLPLFFPVLLVMLFFFTTIILRAFYPPISPVSEGESTRIMPRERVAPFIGEKALRLPATGPSSAKKLGRYEILQEIGHGGMGLVYKGRDPIIDRLVAIKTIRFDRLYEGQEIRSLKERFFKEAQAAGKLIHPNIVTVFDVGEDSGEAYIAMELVEGETLAPYIDPNHLLPVKEVLEALGTVALALDFAHQHGIVHRDVKPSNIMRTQKGQIKVMDFGIAKLPSSTLTQTGSILGTPSYMSPEQIHNRPVDGRSDLFSLGCVLYELLTGTKPFRGENFSALVLQIMEADPVSPSQENHRVPSACDALLTQALAKNPEGRYQDGKEMAEALRKIVHSL
ncbi:MAG: serine/threonine-protein kinase, partial [Deltaproteobacteria bacterium]|nr:serine/threonine-protein kinase [Deltaproteobacteria bacterium]